jgi:nitrous oxide reductase accessory protein NosL
MKKLFIGVVLLSAMLFATVDKNTTDTNTTDTNTVWKSKSIKPKYTIDFDKNTSCLIRNIKLYKDPKWAAKIEVRNGKTVYFSSPKSLFEFYHRPGKWFDIGVKSERDFFKIVVTDYISLNAINAENAYFVYGSRATSPSGDDLVPFDSKEKAKAFADKYSGKRIMKFDEVSDALIRLLNGRI